MYTWSKPRIHIAIKMAGHKGIVLLLFSVIVFSLAQKTPREIGSLEMLHSWREIEYEWPNNDTKQAAIATGDYIPANNILGSVKLYKNLMFATVQRWRLGVPSVLNTVVIENGRSLLKPYPSWEMQKVGNCNALQFALAMEVDINTGYLWVVDTGRINIFAGTPAQNLCPAKLVVFDVNKNVEVFRYVFPSDIVDPNSNFLNDIVLDYVNGEVSFAYITDTLGYKIIVYDVKKKDSYFVNHPESMNPEPNSGDITVNNDTVSVPVVGINGITISQDFRYVYYSPVAGYNLYQVPTYVLRKHYDVKTYGKEVRKVGQKVTQGDGIILSSAGNMYYSALTRNSVYKWALHSDAQKVGRDRVVMETQALVHRNDQMMRWVDTLALSEDGYLYFTSTAAVQFLLGKLDFTEENFHIGRIFVGDNEKSYLSGAKARTEDPNVKYGEPELMYAWTVPQYTYTNKDTFIPNNNLITGIKVYKNKVFVNSPNWRRGAAPSLNLVVNINGSNLLQPYPGPDYHVIGNCDTIQYSQSMETDPNTGWMWIIDTGRTNIFPDVNDTGYSKPFNRCPAKLIIYDMERDVEIRRYVFPTTVVDPTKTFLNDIVLDYVDGKASYAYITDTLDFKLVVYDFVNNTSYFFSDPKSMHPVIIAGSITINGDIIDLTQIGINGIAISERFDEVYYAPVAGYSLYKVPTSVLRNSNQRNNFATYVQKVADRKYHSDGMVMTLKDDLYYPALEDNALYTCKLPCTTETLVARKDATMQWVDTLAMDEDGYVWYTAPAVQRFLTGKMDFTGEQGPNYYIWRVFVNDRSYLSDAQRRTRISTNTGQSLTRGLLWSRVICICLSVISTYVMVIS